MFLGALVLWCFVLNPHRRSPNPNSQHFHHPSEMAQRVWDPSLKLTNYNASKNSFDHEFEGRKKGVVVQGGVVRVIRHEPFEGFVNVWSLPQWRPPSGLPPKKRDTRAVSRRLCGPEHLGPAAGRALGPRCTLFPTLSIRISCQRSPTSLLLILRLSKAMKSTPTRRIRKPCRRLRTPDNTSLWMNCLAVTRMSGNSNAG